MRFQSPVAVLMRSLLLLLMVVFLVGYSQLTPAQTAKKIAQPGTDSSLVARGQYIVEGVAVCGNCHTPRTPSGELDRSRWLAGAPVPYQPSTPPASDVGMITLLTTGIWITGKPLKDPMPKFHMTPADAEAVLAYLKSLNPGR